MIGKISRGWRVGGLIRYLMGPGRFNEHVDPRVVACWDGLPQQWQPPIVDERFDCTELIAELAAPQIAAGLPQQEPAAGANGKRPRGPVWHCSLRNHAKDRVLSDADWARVVVGVLDRTGIGPRDDPFGCRWVAIRHADDHVHIAAVLVRQDTARRVHPEFDYPKVRRVCREVEAHYGLTVTSDADRTATRHPSRAEQEKGRRIVRDHDEMRRVTGGRSSRVVLGEAVRRAAVQAQSLDEFFRLLEERGIRVRARRDRAGRVEGYAVAVPGDVDADQRPVWYSGSRLGRDLSMPMLNAVWQSAPAPPEVIPAEETERTRPGRAERAATVAAATDAVHDTTAALRRGRPGPPHEPGEGAGAGAATSSGSGSPWSTPDDEGIGEDVDAIAHSLRDLLVALDLTATRRRYPELDGVAAHFDTAARRSRDVLPTSWSAEARALRTAAWRLARARVVTGFGPERAPLAALVAAVAALVVEIAAYRATQQRLAHARDAHRTADQLVGAAAARRPPSTAQPITPATARADNPRTTRAPANPPRASPATPPGPRPAPGPSPWNQPGPGRPPGPRGRGR